MVEAAETTEGPWVFMTGIVVYEVGPRDGLQNESETVATASKLTLIEDQYFRG